jgi:hypothetical protein
LVVCAAVSLRRTAFYIKTVSGSLSLVFDLLDFSGLGSSVWSICGVLVARRKK